MSESRLKMKVGIHEFEAEGPADLVAKQFADFKELISALPIPEPAPEKASNNTHDITAASAAPDLLPGPTVNLTKILKVDNNRVVSLTALPNSDREAALLLLFGQKELQGTEAATGGTLKRGLELSGYKPDRIDRMMDGFVGEGVVMVSGKNRGRKYRLSNPGIAKAQALADELTRKLP